MSSWIRDTFERVISTYVEALCGLLIANGTGLTNLDGAKTAAIAAIPAALTVLKSALASRISGTVSPASVARDPGWAAAEQFRDEL